MTHYRRSWWAVLLIVLVANLGAMALALCVLWMMNPSLAEDYRRYGVVWDEVSRVLVSLWIAVIVTLAWWLRTPRVARGNGFPVAR